jgi:hypothetical protein
MATLKTQKSAAGFTNSAFAMAKLYHHVSLLSRAKSEGTIQSALPSLSSLGDKRAKLTGQLPEKDLFRTGVLGELRVDFHLRGNSSLS